MSELMREFLQAWLDWAEGGAPQNAPFDSSYGLCAALYDRNPSFAQVKALGEELRAMFVADGLDECYPFGEQEYDEARANYTQHLNETRLAWIRNKLEQA